MKLILELLDDSLAICQLAPDEPFPEWARHSRVVSSTRTPEELSIVTRESNVPQGVRRSGSWRAFRVEGPLDFSLTGILASLASPLAAAGISLFAISTFDTDYILVRQAELQAAMETLRRAGHRFYGDR